MSSTPTPPEDAGPTHSDGLTADPVPAARKSRKKLWWALAGVIVVLGLIALPIFQPWKLFVDQTVNESLPGLAEASAASTPTAPANSDSLASAAAGTAASATPTGPVAPLPLASGQFISQEHETAGTATVYRLPDGQRVLRLSDFSTSNGPDVHVWLSDQKVQSGEAGWYVFDDGQHVDLGGLKGNIGDQNYVIPADVDLGAYPSVSIWCERFSVSFGAAELAAV